MARMTRGRILVILGTFVLGTLLISYVASQFISDDEAPGPKQETKEEALAGIAKDAYLRQACNMPAEWIKYIDRGYEPGPAQGKDLIIVPNPPGYVGGLISTTHSGPYDFLMDVP